MDKNKKCNKCGNDNFIYDKVDIMGDGVEEHFGKTAIICYECKSVIGYDEV